MSRRPLRIGTRKSPLALAQAGLVRSALEKRGVACELVPMTTTGDVYTKGRLADIGGKGLFTKELEESLLTGQLDLAVHSMKDVETWMHPNLPILGMLEREDPWDILVSTGGLSLEAFEKGASFGTCALRRKAQLLSKRPDLSILPLRGNVQTRLQSIENQQLDAIVLALAGIKRLGGCPFPYHIFSREEMVPSVGQGAIGIQGTHEWTDLVSQISHKETVHRVSLERAFLEEVDGTCGTPVGGLVDLEGDKISFIGCVASPEGDHTWRETLVTSKEQAEQEIRLLGGEMKKWLAAYDV